MMSAFKKDEEFGYTECNIVPEFSQKPTLYIPQAI